ncbi:uncharacterized protein LOC133288048 [Gastrolobium bilobum]|uniref:uncharacterized protein LOC133288048 n=1 Tax=Gastrolobium bilobum TaxID=150636 RepID=UPI002AAF6DB5|nr:uncharacterized protein LOC133288048 [Gastrolobium bilobum]
MTPNTRTLVNAALGGSLKTKTPEETLELLESLASQEYDNAPVAQRRAGIMKLDGYDAILAQNEQILQINKKQQEQLDALTKQFTSAHATEDCRAPETSDVNGIWYDQRNQNNLGRNQHGNNQNPGWRNQNQHPGFSYSSNHQLNPPPVQQQPPQQGNTSEWEKAFAQLSKTTSDYIQSSNAFREDTSAFMQETRASFRNQEVSIRNLETPIGQVSRQFTERVQGTFPGNTIPNPSREHCNAITTTSEKAIEPVVKPSVEKKKDDKPAIDKEKEKEVAKESAAEKTVPEKKEFKWEKKKAQESQEKPLELSPYAKIPYPQRFREEIHKQQYSRFLDIFKKLQINIPFTEALENMPNYVKFMKDLLSRKRKLQECETVTLTEECSAIIQKKLPPKLKDPGSFSILCNKGDVKVENVLCDLGASINVMPLSMMRKLGITKVKPTKTIVQLADRSTKQAYGIIEDILVKVEKFIIPVDFVILDIEENSTIPGRPFLATSGALIDVPKGELILRVDGEQAIFKFFDIEVHSPIIQPCIYGNKAHRYSNVDADMTADTTQDAANIYYVDDVVAADATTGNDQDAVEEDDTPTTDMKED